MQSMKKAVVSLAVISALLITAPVAAAPSYDAQPAPTETQTVQWDHGIALFQSSMPHSQLGVKFLQYDQSKLFFLITLKNKSEASLDFGVDQIALQIPGGRMIKVYTRDELIRAIKQKRDAKKFFAILGATAGVLASVAASQQTRTGTAHDSQGRSYTYMERYTNEAVLAAGTAASVGAGALVLIGANKNADAKIKYLNDNYLVRQTIPAGGEIVGVIEAQMPKMTSASGSIEMNVTASGDVHNMHFNIAKN